MAYLFRMRYRLFYLVLFLLLCAQWWLLLRFGESYPGLKMPGFGGKPAADSCWETSVLLLAGKKSGEPVQVIQLKGAFPQLPAYWPGMALKSIAENDTRKEAYLKVLHRQLPEYEALYLVKAGCCVQQPGVSYTTTDTTALP